MTSQTLTQSSVPTNSPDPLMDQALAYFKSSKGPFRVSTIQRVCRVGPNRALNVMNELVEAGHMTARATTRGGVYLLVKPLKVS